MTTTPRPPRKTQADPYPDLSVVSTLESNSSVRSPTRQSSPINTLLSFIHEITDSGAVRDGLKLIVVGGILEASRRGLGLLFRQVYYYATIEAIFSEDDPAYRWIIAWLSVPERQSDARNFEVISTKYQERAVDDAIPGMGDVEEGRKDMFDGLALIPAFDHPRYIKFEGRLYRFERYSENKTFGDPIAMLKVSVLSRSQSAIHRLIASAHATSLAHTATRLVTYTPAKGNTYWHETSSRPARSLESVVLPGGVKERVVADLGEFLGGAKWYAERGIPHRRGYLCYGVPGSGKTSLISAIAGHFSLPVYIVNLAQSGLDDSALAELIGLCPPRSTLLMEDIDCCSTSRDAEQSSGGEKSFKGMEISTKASNVTLSGLLNCIDGVGASEGRVLFATTNHVERLDPALKRPGRMDVWIEFKNATTPQIHDLFTNFYPAALGSTETKSHLADRFAEQVPADTFSIAAIQGFLMQYRSQPNEAVQRIGEWVRNGGRAE